MEKHRFHYQIQIIFNFEHCLKQVPIVYQYGYGNGKELVHIITLTERSFKKLNANGMRAEFKFVNPDVNNLENWMKMCFTQLLSIAQHRLDIEPQDRVGIAFQNIECDKTSFNISFRRFDQYSAEVVLSALAIVLQSNINFLVDDNLVINVDHVRVPTGGSRRSCVGKTKEDFLKIHNRSIFAPNLRAEDGNICLPVALVIGVAFNDGAIGQNFYNRLTYPPNHRDLITEAKKLARAADVNYINGCGIDEIRKFEEYFSNSYNLNVYASRDGRNIYHKSNRNKKHINLLLDNNHYSLIKSLTAVFSTAYFCSYCAEPYTTRLQHRSCPFKCDRCYRVPPCEEAVIIKCQDCNRDFVNANCFNHHLKTYICLKIRICTKCLTTYSYDKKKPKVQSSAAFAVVTNQHVMNVLYHLLNRKNIN